ncbi:MAG: hypothetical protein A2X48_08235 [Lentisphaerae bacterium GWF2_49_21]|nr:MAG: hypothetical protein A2X48_08235 [Lentisphaerae bacterium GWF2_49_21]
MWKHTPCLWKNITGIPCPGCGMTRACTAVFHLDLQSAFQHHPLFLIIPFLAYLFLFPGSWLGRRLVANNLFWCIIGGLFIGAYVIRMIVLFPDHSPMTGLHPCLIDLVRNLF